MEKWDEMRTAYMVAKLGTVSAASDVLGIHRATIIRHIDSLEAALGAKIFLRHARVCGWHLHCKRFVVLFAHISSVQSCVRPVYVSALPPLALMNSASEVPYG